MSLKLKLFSILFSLIMIAFVLHLVKKDKIAIKYSLVWLFPCIMLLIFVLVPGFFAWVTNMLGFQTGSNMVLTILVGILFTISISLTLIVSRQKEQIRLLVQEVSLLKEKK